MPFTFDPEDIDMSLMLASDDLGGGRFRNRCNHRNASGSLFGGQMVAQSLAAADRTIDGKDVHSLHAYFLRGGRADIPVEYEVDRERDGRRFATRAVRAWQGDSLLFTMSCSYRTALPGYEHQRARTNGADPEAGLDLISLIRSGTQPELAPFEWYARARTLEVRIPEETGFLRRSAEPVRHYWLRVPDAGAIDDPGVHRQMLAYLSDFFLVGAALAPHTVPLPGPGLFVASLDHALWFHRNVRCDDWLLFETHGPSARGGVNLVLGYIYDRAGDLVATVAQEALQLPSD